MLERETRRDDSPRPGVINRHKGGVTLQQGAHERQAQAVAFALFGISADCESAPST